jgi:hypothetical protein
MRTTTTNRRSFIRQGAIGAGALIAFGPPELLSSRLGATPELARSAASVASVPYGGLAYDPVGRRVFIGRGSGDTLGGSPRVYVWEHAAF